MLGKALFSTKMTKLEMDETVELKIIVPYNHVLAQFPLTTTETELDYYHHTVNVGVATRYSERFKT